MQFACPRCKRKSKIVNDCGCDPNGCARREETTVKAHKPHGYILVTADESYWWLHLGGFGKVYNGSTPFIASTEEAARSKCAEIEQQTGQTLHPVPFTIPAA